MSFQRGHVREHGNRRFDVVNLWEAVCRSRPILTAPEAIDPKPPHYPASRACHSRMGKCVGMESMRGGTKMQKPHGSASTAIDPMPLPTSPRRDDIPVEACK